MSPADSDKQEPPATPETKPEAEKVEPEKAEPEVPGSAPPLAAMPVEDISDLEEHHPRRFLMLVVYFLMALAVAILVVFGGRWIYRTVTKGNKPAPVPTTNQPAPQQPATPTTPSPSPQPSPPAGETQQTGAQPSQLPDNGPGNIAILFVGVALVTGGLHYLYQLRRAD